MLGSDVWLDGAEQEARPAAEELRLPVIANGQGRGILPAGHELLVTQGQVHRVLRRRPGDVAGTPLDFRLGYGEFGGRDAPRAPVVHVMDAPGQIATHRPLAAAAAGDLSAFFAALGVAAGGGETEARRSGWPGCRGRPGPRSRPTRPCSPARPPRSTRCGCTGS